MKAGTSQGGYEDVTAVKLLGKYLIVVDVNGVPVNNGEQIDFYIKSFVVVGEERVYSKEVTVSFVGGVENESVALLTEAVQ